MLFRRLKYICAVFTMLALPAAALHASPDATEMSELRAAVLQADGVIETDIRAATAQVLYETDLSAWLKIKDVPSTILEIPTRPEPARAPESPREHMALIAYAGGSGVKGESTHGAQAIIRHHLEAKTALAVTGAHVPSAYLKYLSLRFHAGPPARV